MPEIPEQTAAQPTEQDHENARIRQEFAEQQLEAYAKVLKMILVVRRSM